MLHAVHIYSNQVIFNHLKPQGRYATRAINPLTQITVLSAQSGKHRAVPRHKQQPRHLAGLLFVAPGKTQPFCRSRIRKVSALASSATPVWSRTKVSSGVPSLGLSTWQAGPRLGHS